MLCAVSHRPSCPLRGLTHFVNGASSTRIVPPTMRGDALLQLPLPPLFETILSTSSSGGGLEATNGNRSIAVNVVSLAPVGLFRRRLKQNLTRCVVVYC